MEMLIQGIVALLLLAATVYVQRKLPAYTRGHTRILMTRAILVLVGIGFGLTATLYVYGSLAQLLAFLIGFGMVHMPAAIVLFIKSKRGEGKS